MEFLSFIVSLKNSYSSTITASILEPGQHNRRHDYDIDISLAFQNVHLGWANGFAQLARNASLLAARVTPQRVLPTEARAQRSLFEGVVDGHLRLREHLCR